VASAGVHILRFSPSVSEIGRFIGLGEVPRFCGTTAPKFSQFSTPVHGSTSSGGANCTGVLAYGIPLKIFILSLCVPRISPFGVVKFIVIGVPARPLSEALDELLHADMVQNEINAINTQNIDCFIKISSLCALISS
jgi:hypothetical protein